MAYAVAVIIPARNEESTVDRAIRSAWSAGAAEVIVADGGSSDATIARARASGAAVLESDWVRGKRLNSAAATTHSPILLFLHADSILPPTAAQTVVEAIGDGHIFGGFRIRFIESHPMLRLAAALINLRTAVSRCPWGDQAQFIRRDVFFQSGGFKEYPLMEDYEMAIRMKGQGSTVLLPYCVETSGRRFLEQGFLRTVALNWRLIAAYRVGADPVRLEKMYRR